MPNGGHNPYADLEPWELAAIQAAERVWRDMGSPKGPGKGHPKGAAEMSGKGPAAEMSGKGQRAGQTTDGEGKAAAPRPKSAATMPPPQPPRPKAMPLPRGQWVYAWLWMPAPGSVGAVLPPPPGVVLAPGPAPPAPGADSTSEEAGLQCITFIIHSTSLAPLGRMREQNQKMDLKLGVPCLYEFWYFQHFVSLVVTVVHLPRACAM